MPDLSGSTNSPLKTSAVLVRTSKKIGLWIKNRVKEQLANRRIIRSDASCITEALDDYVDRLIHTLAKKPGDLTPAERRLGEALVKYKIDVRRSFERHRFPRLPLPPW